ncbi:MAG TPA: PTS sugar transporter subunit IIB [Lachnoclostridium sp.]|jgi:PTS system cellobiose-specific IIB component|uniref:PTS sugar transporter subunit IIB n=1 Tax=Clostridium sp. WB02_MRS01 TaxID=2605777 RepID=UPI000E96DA2C|nr:PTS sugar transporter subunit IIB [Clostridium sp. WB02_MRS01]MSS08420.1 PTS sugar transporter subunit IIB [Clostridium sp. WB02_MRS01]HBC98239.1 PTS sugar transporter subunit IIB [Lachnoclostridium sp.]
MLNILLVCNAGMSTSMVVKKMRDAAKERGLEAEINARPISECKDLIDTLDIILLGPQVKFQKPQVDKLVEGKIPVEVMDMRSYGTMNGAAILDQALKILNL